VYVRKTCELIQEEQWNNETMIVPNALRLLAMTPSVFLLKAPVVVLICSASADPDGTGRGLAASRQRRKPATLQICSQIRGNRTR
jgi:hypothetical protein